MQDLLAFLNRYKTGDNIAMAEPLDVIRIWLLHHIKAFDGKLKIPAPALSENTSVGLPMALR